MWSRLMLFTIGFAVVVMCVMTTTVYAEKSMKTVEIPVGYIQQTVANQDYIETVSINPPDGISKIVSIEIKIIGDFQSSTDVISRVRKTGTQEVYSCNPSSWTSPSVNTPNYMMYFDCSSLSSKFSFTNGKIDIGFQSSKISQNVKAHIVVTYMNSQTSLIEVHGTDYYRGDNATVFAQLTNNNEVINNGSCKTDVVSRNGTFILDNVFMEYIQGTDGLYHADFSAPNDIGVYGVTVMCVIPTLSQNLHAQFFTIVNGTENVGDVFYTHLSDTQYHVTQETPVNPRTYFATYNFTNFTLPIENLTELGVTVSYFLRDSATGALPADEDFSLGLYNWSSTSCVLFDKTLTPRIEEGRETISTSFLSEEKNLSYFVNGDMISLCISDTVKDDTDRDRLEIDELSLFGIANQETPINKIRGSGEINVISWADDILEKIEQVNNSIYTILESLNISSNVTVTFDGTIINNITFQPNITVNYTDSTNMTPVLEGIQYVRDDILSLNTTLLTQLQQLEDNINYLLGNLTAYISSYVNNIVSGVWSYPNRTLTEINATIIGGNITINPNQIWNYPNKSLNTWCEDGDSIGECAYEYFWRAGAVL